VLNTRFFIAKEGSRISYQDFVSYFVILVDDSTSNWICRLLLGNSESSRIKKSIALPSDERKEIRFDLNSLDDIYLQRRNYYLSKSVIGALQEETDPIC